MSTSRPSSVHQRQPWLSCALLLIFAIALTYSRQLEREVRANSDAATARAADYWSERPYLEPAEIVVRHLGSDTVESRRAEHRREQSRARAVAIPKAVKSHYQEILDGLTAEALEPLSKLPHYRLGVRGEGDGRAYFAHAFLHSGWLQLAGNGVLLIALGFAIERIWGHALFAAVALASSLGAAVAFRLGNPELDAAWIGASGMLAGLLGAFAVRFAARWSEPGYGAVIAAGACWLLAPGALGWNASLVAGPTSSGPIEAAAQASLWGIAGGFACGLAIGALIVFGRIESILLGAAAEPTRRASAEPELEQAIAAHADGRSEEAFESLAALLQRKPDHRAALLAMWEVALEVGRPVDASNALLRVIREEVRRNAPAAVDHWLELVRRGLHGGAEPALLVHVALMLSAAQRPREALDALERALEISSDGGSTQIATRVARASRLLDPKLSLEAAWRALGSLELAFADRQSLEALLGELYRAGVTPRESADPPAAGASSASAAAPAEPATGPRAEDPLLRWEDPELPDETGLSRGEPLVPVDDSTPDRVGAEAFAAVRPAPIELEIASRELRVISAQPIEWVEDALVIEVERGDKRKVAFDRIDALSVVAIDGAGSQFAIVVDLILNWMSGPAEPLKVIRLRGDQFDPLPFAPGVGNPLDAMRAFTTRLLERSNAVALPDARSVRGEPFASFPDLASYHRTVFSVEEEAAESGSGG